MGGWIIVNHYVGTLFLMDCLRLPLSIAALGVVALMLMRAVQATVQARLLAVDRVVSPCAVSLPFLN